MVLFMLQSCGGSNTNHEEDDGLVDVNPVVEEDEQDTYDSGDNDDGRDDERELDNEQDPDSDGDDVEIGLDYEIGEDDNPDYGYGFQ